MNSDTHKERPKLPRAQIPGTWTHRAGLVPDLHPALLLPSRAHSCQLRALSRVRVLWAHRVSFPSESWTSLTTKTSQHRNGFSEPHPDWRHRTSGDTKAAFSSARPLSRTVSDPMSPALLGPPPREGWGGSTNVKGSWAPCKSGLTTKHSRLTWMFTKQSSWEYTKAVRRILLWIHLEWTYTYTYSCTHAIQAHHTQMLIPQCACTHRYPHLHRYIPAYTNIHTTKCVSYAH